MGVNDDRCGNPPQRYPRKRPTVGAGSSQREDSPAHRNIRIPCHPQRPRFLSRRAASLSAHAVPVDARMGVNGGRCGNPPNDLAAKPTVGAGSSQREDSPAHRHPPPYAQIAPMKDPTVFVATRRAASRSKTPRRTLKHHRTPKHRTAPQTAASPLTPHRAPNAPPSPLHPPTLPIPTCYQRATWAASCSGLALRRNPRMQLSWY